MKPLVSTLLAAALACATASASPPGADDLRISFAGQGDSVVTKVWYHVIGAADSTILVYTAPHSVAVRHNRVPTQIADSGILLPVPPVAEGDSLPVTVTVTPYWKGKVGRSATASASYYRAPSATIDSLRISLGQPAAVKLVPKTVILASGRMQLFCGYVIYVNGSVVPASNNDPGCGETPASAPMPEKSLWLKYASWSSRGR
jgi:hypothetical protein